MSIGSPKGCGQSREGDSTYLELLDNVNGAEDGGRLKRQHGVVALLDRVGLKKDEKVSTRWPSLD